MLHHWQTHKYRRRNGHISCDCHSWSHQLWRQSENQCHRAVCTFSYPTDPEIWCITPRSEFELLLSWTDVWWVIISLRILLYSFLVSGDSLSYTKYYKVLSRINTSGLSRQVVSHRGICSWLFLIWKQFYFNMCFIKI